MACIPNCSSWAWSCRTYQARMHHGPSSNSLETCGKGSHIPFPRSCRSLSANPQLRTEKHLESGCPLWFEEDLCESVLKGTMATLKAPLYVASEEGFQMPWMARKPGSNLTQERKTPASSNHTEVIYLPIDQTLGHILVAGYYSPAYSLSHINMLATWKPGIWTSLNRKWHFTLWPMSPADCITVLICWGCKAHLCKRQIHHKPGGKLGCTQCPSVHGDKTQILFPC